MDLDAQKRQIKILYRRLYDEVFKLDLYAQPLSLTYQGKTNFSTTYGIVMTIITFCLVLFVIIDTLVYGDTTSMFQYKTSLNANTTFTIDFTHQTAIYISMTSSIDGSQYDVNSVLTADLVFQNITYSTSNQNSYLTQSDNGTEIATFQLCEYDNLSQDANTLLKSFNNPLCLSGTAVIYVNNVYSSEFYIRLTKKPGSTTNLTLYTLNIHLGELLYNANSSTFSTQFTSFPLPLSDYATRNTYYNSMHYKRFTFYTGYFNLMSTSEFFFFSDQSTFYNNTINPVTKDPTNTTYVFFCEVFLPIVIEETYYQNVNFLNSISIIAGYMFLFYSGVKFCVTKCATVKLNESIANNTFNLITPQNKHIINEMEKTTKDKLSSDEINNIILDLAVDEFYKYNEHRGLNFTFWQVQNYLCCCFCCKNKNQVQLEKTFTRALDELYKSVDVVNVIKCSQEIKVFKEILFEPNQRQIFDFLLRPTIDGEKIISSYNTEMGSKFETMEEVHIMQKSALKDSFMQLSKQDIYSETEMKLIELLYIDPGLKKKFFNHEDKDLNSKDNFISTFKLKLDFLSPKLFTPNLTKLFDNLVTFVERELGNIKKNITDSVDECNIVSKNYKLMCDENKILKDILYNSYEKGINPKVKKLTNYHPLLNSKERNDKQINLMRLLYTKNTNNNLLDHFEGIFGLFFDLIDYIFCVRNAERYINKYVNDHTLQAFKALSHCLKISFICLLIFSVYNIIAISNNHGLISTEYNGNFLSIGYLSFARQPNNNGDNEILRIYVVCLQIYLTFYFTYVLFLLIQKYLSSSESNFIEGNFPLTKFFFTSPTIRINKESEKKFFLNYFLIETLSITDKLYNWSIKTKIVNTLLFLFGVGLILGNIILSIFINRIFKVFEDQPNYFVRTMLLALFLAIFGNFFPILIQFTLNFYMDVVPETLEKMKFWMPFFSKYSSYTILLVINFNLFLGDSQNALASYTPAFDDANFICREDQAAYNLLVFIILEFIMRKFFMFFFSLFTYRLRLKFDLNFLIINVMCKFYILNITTLIYPAQGFYMFLIFFLEFQYEMMILRNFRMPPLTILKPEVYEEYSIFCLAMNLVTMIIINILFQNQYTMLSNQNNNYVTNDLNNLPIMCIHNVAQYDLQTVFKSIFNPAFMAGFQSLQMFIFIPSIIVIYQILTNSKALIQRYGANLKFLLKMIQDTKPIEMFKNIKTNKDNLALIFASYDAKKTEIVKSKDKNKHKNNIFKQQDSEMDDEIRVKGEQDVN